MDDTDFPAEFDRVLFTEKQIAARVKELAAQVDEDYSRRTLLLVGVLEWGAMMIMADLSRELKTPAEIDWMAVSRTAQGYLGGVVRILRTSTSASRAETSSSLRMSWILGSRCDGWFAACRPATKDAEVADVAS